MFTLTGRCLLGPLPEGRQVVPAGRKQSTKNATMVNTLNKK